MKVIFFRSLLAVLAILWIAPVASADSWTLGLLPPSGAISGPAGSTIGWGFTIINQSATNWLVLTGLSSDPFLNATPDASIFGFPILAPMASITVPYTVNLQGLFQITWDANAPVGFANLGTFVLSGEF